MKNKIRAYFRKDTFAARGLTFGMIPLFFMLAVRLGTFWTHGETISELKYFGIVGILLGSLVGHLLYYHWIFPEKRRVVKD